MVRLGVVWEAAYEEEQLNQTYIKALEKIIQRLADAGIYTLLVSNTDLLSKRICGFGIPDRFASPLLQNDLKCQYDSVKQSQIKQWVDQGVCYNFDAKFAMKKDSQGFPLEKECQKWPKSQFYGSLESLELYDAFYTNKNGIQEEYMKFIQLLGRRFRDNSNVIGIEPLNNPFIANFVKNPSLLKP